MAEGAAGHHGPQDRWTHVGETGLPALTSPQIVRQAGTAVQPVFNPFSQFIPQLELYSQLQLSLWCDPIAFSVP